MAVDVAAFRVQFPEFTEAQADDTTVQRALDEALDIHDVNERATLYAAAHILTVTKPAAAGNTSANGAVLNRAAGPIRTSYVALVKDGDIRADMARTHYGVRFLFLESRIPKRVIAARVAG